MKQTCRTYFAARALFKSRGGDSHDGAFEVTLNDDRENNFILQASLSPDKSVRQPMARLLTPITSAATPNFMSPPASGTSNAAANKQQGGECTTRPDHSLGSATPSSKVSIGQALFSQTPVGQSLYQSERPNNFFTASRPSPSDNQSKVGVPVRQSAGTPSTVNNDTVLQRNHETAVDSKPSEAKVEEKAVKAEPKSTPVPERRDSPQAHSPTQTQRQSPQASPTAPAPTFTHNAPPTSTEPIVFTSMQVTVPTSVQPSAHMPVQPTSPTSHQPITSSCSRERIEQLLKKKAYARADVLEALSISDKEHDRCREIMTVEMEQRHILTTRTKAINFQDPGDKNCLAKQSMRQLHASKSVSESASTLS